MCINKTDIVQILDQSFHCLNYCGFDLSNCVSQVVIPWYYSILLQIGLIKLRFKWYSIDYCMSFILYKDMSKTCSIHIINISLYLFKIIIF